MGYMAPTIGDFETQSLAIASFSYAVALSHQLDKCP